MAKFLLGVLVFVLLLAGIELAVGHEPLISLRSTEFIVLISFVLFLGVLVYFKVPGMINGLLDKRADTIRAELEEARGLREEAQTILASYERKHKEVAEQAEHIVAHARLEATEAAELAKADIKASIARRLAAAEDQIKSAEAAAVKEVRDTAVTVAVGAAQDVIAAKLSATDQNGLIDAAIADVEGKLH